ncbi:MAG: hypothetical protein VB093_10790 [Propionicimonas sp.]|nr:hypothetical protein [Propionicimonas sp.]MEA5117580.1 hypothetical protein [Propionicimonas sp.]
MTQPLPASRPRPRGARGRLAVLALGGGCLIAGLDAALLRLDLWAPVDSARVGDVHGLVMALGFLGTLIALERAQALHRNWAYLAPVLLGLGGLVLLTPAPRLLGNLLQVEGAVLFVVVYLALWQRAPRPLVAVQVLSAVLALGGAVVVVLVDIPAAVSWLAGFIVLTIASERAELAQLWMGPRAERTLLGLSAALTLAIAAGLAFPAVGQRLVGVVLVGCAGWLVLRDAARHQLRLRGQRRYIAVALLAGYLNLALAGGVLAVRGLVADQAGYDIVVHGVFLGFAVSMVMAHAPVILPAVLGRPLPYRPVLYLPLVLLHGGLLVRFTAAFVGAEQVWRVGGVVTVVAMLVFLLTAVTLVVRGEPGGASPRGRGAAGSAGAARAPGSAAGPGMRGAADSAGAAKAAGSAGSADGGVAMGSAGAAKAAGSAGGLDGRPCPGSPGGNGVVETARTRKADR